MPSRTLPPHFVLSTEVAQAQMLKLPLVALESTVITHGLPSPENLKLAREMESIVRAEGAVPATIALMDGKILIGLTAEQLENLARAENSRKISRRDFGIALAKKEAGGTTVAGTLFAAHAAGIQVFATGGIGGVHRDAPFDISADLPELSRTPLVVVCAGAKSILDLPSTLEYLETAGVPVLGYQTDVFPAFFSASSGLPVTARADSPEEVAAIARTHWSLGLASAVLVAQPLPEGTALPGEKMDALIRQAVADASSAEIHGPATTPYLLSRLTELSGGESLQANLALLHNNARLAARIAAALTPRLPVI